MDEERLIVALEARIRDFEKNMIKAEKRGTQSYQSLRRGSKVATTAMERDMLSSTARINQALASTSTRIGAFGKAFIAGAVATGIAALTRGATEAVRSLAEVDRQARRSGVSVTAFQELKFVSEQSRIDVDTMVDGLKELQLRADEFVVTGKGSAADAFKRLGYNAKELTRRLEEPDELFLDIVKRMEDLDRAAQIRVADEVFGGTGGERFVELLGQGEAGIRKMMTRAHELGAVIEEDTVAKAAELDRKFAEITQRISTLSKTIVVNLAGAIEDALTIDVDEIFGSAERAIAMMGEANYRAMKDGEEATDDQRRSAEELVDVYDELFRTINAATGPDGIRLMDVADVEEAHDLAAILQDIATEMQAFQTGATNAGEFEDAVSDLIEEAQSLLAELDDVDRKRFGNVIAAISGIAEALRTASRNAVSLRENLPEGNADTATYGPQNGRRPNVELRPGEYAPEISPRPQLPSVDFGSAPSSGSGGGGRSADDFQKEVARTQDEIARLEAEAVALAAVADSGTAYGNAVDYARKRAELLYQAQAAGKDLTPELRAEIDQLALAYAQAGTAADSAADRLDMIEENAMRGADAMSDLFLGILDGSKSAGEALKDLLLQLAEIQLQRSIIGLATSGGGSGFFSAVGSLLGFSGGGYTGAGGKHEPAGVVHRGEYVVQASQVRRPGVLGLLEGINNGMPGFAGGGLVDSIDTMPVSPRAMTIQQPRVSPSTALQPGSTKVDVDVRAFVDEDGNWQARVAKISQNVSAGVTGNAISQKTRVDRRTEQQRARMRELRGI